MTPIVAVGLFLVAGIFGGVLLRLVGVGMALIAVPLLTNTLPFFGVGSDVARRVALVAVGSVSSLVSHHRLGSRSQC
jgi:uncharacterized membrane protein YfcA